MMRRTWKRSVTIQVVEIRTVEVEVEHYAGSPPTLTDPGEPEMTWASEAHDIETEEVVELSDEEAQLAIDLATKEEKEEYHNRFYTGPKPF
tara:strand:+ start:186 stop:458 length:273 start_codon:yes stop_codon:yes gene_type:complete